MGTANQLKSPISKDIPGTAGHAVWTATQCAGFTDDRCAICSTTLPLLHAFPREYVELHQENGEAEHSIPDINPSSPD